MIAGSSSTDSVVGRALGKASDRLEGQTFDSATKQADAERAQAEGATTERTRSWSSARATSD